MVEARRAVSCHRNPDANRVMNSFMNNQLNRQVLERET
jgi:hypothetical protein